MINNNAAATTTITTTASWQNIANPGDGCCHLSLQSMLMSRSCK